MRLVLVILGMSVWLKDGCDVTYSKFTTAYIKQGDKQSDLLTDAS